MNNRVEDQLDNMINELNAVNDEFINVYFDEEGIVQNNDEMLEEVEEFEANDSDELEFDMPEEENIKEEAKQEEIEETIIEKQPETIIEKQEDKPKFSYNEILSRLDNTEKGIDITDTNDLLKLIDRTSSADEFFETLEEAMDND